MSALGQRLGRVYIRMDSRPLVQTCLYVNGQLIQGQIHNRILGHLLSKLFAELALVTGEKRREMHAGKQPSRTQTSMRYQVQKVPQLAIRRRESKPDTANMVGRSIDEVQISYLTWISNLVYLCMISYIDQRYDDEKSSTVQKRYERYERQRRSDGMDNIRMPQHLLNEKCIIARNR